MEQDNRSLNILNPSSHLIEAYKKLQVNIQIASMNQKVKVIQVTSSEAGEGKTFTVANLAAVYASKNKKTIVLDLDFRKPKIHQVFNFDIKNGVIDVLAENISLEEAIKHHESGVDILTRGSKPLNIELTLESEKLENLVNKLKETYDVILLDCPPTMVVTDASLITKLADGLLFVVAYNHSKKDIVKESIKRIKSTGVNLLGVVLSQIEKASERSYYNSGYYYYNYNSYSETNDNEGGNE